jgi:hypothetical protein
MKLKNKIKNYSKIIKLKKYKKYIKNNLNKLELTCQTHKLNHKIKIIS